MSVLLTAIGFVLLLAIITGAAIAVLSHIFGGARRNTKRLDALEHQLAIVVQRLDALAEGHERDEASAPSGVDPAVPSSQNAAAMAKAVVVEPDSETSQISAAFRQGDHASEADHAANVEGAAAGDDQPVSGDADEANAPEGGENYGEAAKEGEHDQDFAAIGQPRRRWRTPSTSVNFEELFGRQLPIWIGGFALIVSGFFLVRWSIEQGFLSEGVRVGIGFAFGAALIAGAEAARRFKERVRDPRVAQALAGAGIATLYSCFFLAGQYYGLISATFAFGGLAVVSALAIFLSFRFGLPCAVLGLVGGFLTPLLSGGSEPNMPLLTFYLALLTAGLGFAGREQARSGLGITAVAVALLWGLVLMLGGNLDATAIVALGLYILAVGIVVPTVLGSGRGKIIAQVAASILVACELALLVRFADFSVLGWAFYGLLALAVTGLGFKWVQMRYGAGFAAFVSILLLSVWPEPAAVQLGLVSAGFAAIFMLAPLWRIIRGEAGIIAEAEQSAQRSELSMDENSKRQHNIPRFALGLSDLDCWQLALYPLALIVVLLAKLDESLIAAPNFSLAFAALVLAVPPALAARHLWPAPEQRMAGTSFGLTLSALLLGLCAGLLATPPSLAGFIALAIAAISFALCRKRTDAGSQGLVAVFALIGVICLFAPQPFPSPQYFWGGEGEAGPVSDWLIAARWLAAAIPFGFLAYNPHNRWQRGISQTFAVLLGYGAVAAIIPSPWLPTILALAAVATAKSLSRSAAALITLLLLSFGWAASDLYQALIAGLEALAAIPELVTALPSLSATLIYVAPLAAAVLAVLSMRGAMIDKQPKTAAWAFCVALCLMVLHVAYKQLFLIDSEARFVIYGLGERTVWQALLAGAGLALCHSGGPALKRFGHGKLGVLAEGAGLVLIFVALAHFMLFSLLYFNPLIYAQHVGPWPIFNLLFASYGLAIGLLAWFSRRLPPDILRLRSVANIVIMVLVTVFALSELRQAFAGTLLVETPLSQTENLLRSLLGVGLAVLFLWWGARTHQRVWRIGSLVLMLAAVVKVFLFDAAALSGLARIASFFGLGLCLIGIGWFYSRQLRSQPKLE